MITKSNDHSHAVEMLAACYWLHKEPRADTENEPSYTGKAASLLADGFTHTIDYWVTNDAAKWQLGKNLIIKSSWI